MNTEMQKIPIIGNWLSYHYGYDGGGNGNIHIKRIFRWIYRKKIKAAEDAFDKYFIENEM